MPPPPGPAIPKPRPYKRILTSTLHTRFVQAASSTYIWNLVIAWVITEKPGTISGFFWFFFPIGPTGIKAALFCLSSVFIFILEIATLNIGRRTTPSNLTTLKSSLFSYSTYATFFWYLVSAWWFCEVFVFTSPVSQELGWVLRGGYGEPDRLNERPIYSRMFFLLLGVSAATSHLYHDQSSLHIRVTKPPTPQSNNVKTHSEDGLMTRFTTHLSSMLIRAGIASGVCTIAGPFLYTGLFRGLFWSVHVTMAKTFVSLARSDAHPPRGFYIGGIMPRVALYAFLLCFTWELTLLFFHTYMAQEPTKKGLPLSAASKDPNGTLMTGVAAKRDLTKTFALWELAIIAQSQQERRKAIFADIDRPTGPVFKSLLDSSLKIVASIDERIKSLNPPAPSATSLTQQADVQHLPRLLPDAKSYDKSIYATMPAKSRTQRMENFVSKEAQILGSSPKPWSPPVDQAKQRFQKLVDTGVQEYSKYDAVATQTPLGRLMLTTPERVISSAILGNPIGNAAIIVDAIESITKMLIASLNEDTFGKAVAGVPGTVKQFSKTIYMMETFLAKNASNLSLRQQQHEAEVKAVLKEVVIVHARLKQGLKELLAAFHVFLNDVGLGIKDLNEAKAAAEPRDLLPRLQGANGGSAGSQKSQTQANGQARKPAIQNQMEEVGGVSRRPARSTDPRPRDLDGARIDGKQGNNTFPSRQQAPAAIANAPGSAATSGNGFDRPGRLFSQLDPGSAYSEKFQSQSQSASGATVTSSSRQTGMSTVANTVPARLRSGNNPKEIADGRADNVFGARDPNTNA